MWGSRPQLPLCSLASLAPSLTGSPCCQLHSTSNSESMRTDFSQGPESVLPPGHGAEAVCELLGPRTPPQMQVSITCLTRRAGSTEPGALAPASFSEAGATGTSTGEESSEWGEATGQQREGCPRLTSCGHPPCLAGHTPTPPACLPLVHCRSSGS